jgi:hypothetical protein
MLEIPPLCASNKITHILDLMTEFCEQRAIAPIVVKLSHVMMEMEMHIAVN